MAKSTNSRPDQATGNDAVEVSDPRTTDVAESEHRIPPAVLQAAAPQSISDDVLRDIKSFDDAVAAAAAVSGGVIDDYAEKYGTGFDVVDKDVFINKTIVLLEWRFSRGDFGPFVSVVVMAKDGSKGIINDGSTGIFEQLYRISAEDGKYTSLMVPKGLRVSEYDTCPGHAAPDGSFKRPCGAPRPRDVERCEVCGSDSEERLKGRTFYLDQSKS